MLLRCAAVLLLAPALLGCGRRSPLATGRTDAAQVLGPDAAAGEDLPDRDSPRWDEGGPDTASWPDSESSGFDSGRADSRPGQGDAISGPCSALKPLADQGLLTPLRTRQAFFAPDRTWLALRVRPEQRDSPGAPDRLIRVDLPSGKVSQIAAAVSNVESLGTEGSLLVEGTADGASTSVYDRDGLRTLYQTGCEHKATPDGSRVYVIQDCTSSSYGQLVVVQVASGSAVGLAKDVRRGSLAVSPGGKWVSFAVATDAARGTTDTTVLWLADDHGDSYAVTSQPTPHSPYFVSDDLLLFHVRSSISSGSTEDIVGHFAGKGDTSYLVAASRDTGYPGHQLSPDKTLLLGAAFQDPGRTELYSIRIDGQGQHLLATDLFPYMVSERAINAFALDGSGQYALYTSNEGAIWAVDLEGKSTRKLGDDATFGVTPEGALAILIDHSSRPNGTTSARLRLMELDSGKELLVFTSDGSINYATLLRGRSLLFFDGTNGGRQHLRLLSPLHPDTVVLGEWSSSSLWPQASPYSTGSGIYPVDPTGCFTIVDTDLAPGPGTRLVILPD